MIDLGMYVFKYLYPGIFTPVEYFMNEHVEEDFESEHVCNSTEQLNTFLDAKLEELFDEIVNLYGK